MRWIWREGLVPNVTVRFERELVLFYLYLPPVRVWLGWGRCPLYGLNWVPLKMWRYAFGERPRE